MEMSYNENHQCESLTVATVGRVDIIDWNNLVRIEASSNYSRLFLSNGKTLFVAKVLKKFEAELDKRMFIRPHKTHLVNLSFISAYHPGTHPTLLLSNGESIPVARKMKKQFYLMAG